MANKQLHGTNIPTGPLMLQAEVARMMGLSRERVRQLSLAGELPVREETYGGRALFYMSDVKRLMEKREARR